MTLERPDRTHASVLGRVVLVSAGRDGPTEVDKMKKTLDPVACEVCEEREADMATYIGGGGFLGACQDCYDAGVRDSAVDEPADWFSIDHDRNNAAMPGYTVAAIEEAWDVE